MGILNQIIIMASFLLCTIAFIIINNIYFLKEVHSGKKILKNIQLILISPLSLTYAQYFICKKASGLFSELLQIDQNTIKYKILFTFTELLTITVLMIVLSWLCSKIIHADINVCRFIYYLFVILILCVDSISFNVPTVIIASLIMLLCNYRLFSKELHILTENIDVNAIRKINILPIAVLGMQYIVLTFWNILPDDMAPEGKVTPLAVIMACFSLGLYAFLCLSYRIAFNNYEQRIELKSESEEKLKTQEEVILAFAEIVEAKSSQTGQHVKRVSEYSYVLAKGMEISETEAQKIRIAAMMHDIGKLMIPSEILEKPGKLSQEEFDIIKTHVTVGENILHNAPGDIMAYAKQIALDHHEKWNGKGYLFKKEDEISLCGRIVAVADVYDALVSKRSYKNAWSETDAKQQIISDSGTHFDPHIVDVFVKNYNKILNVLNSFPDGKFS